MLSVVIYREALGLPFSIFSMAGVMVAALPVILAYVLPTKQLIRGLTAGALKG